MKTLEVHICIQRDKQRARTSFYVNLCVVPVQAVQRLQIHRITCRERTRRHGGHGRCALIGRRVVEAPPLSLNEF